MGHNHTVDKTSETSVDVPVDPVLSASIDLAREAVVAEAGADKVGDHLGMAMEDERLATHLFDCASAGYRGWRWAVTLARTPDENVPTVCDVVLLPGPDAVLSPAWVPWSERVQPGDLGVGDVLPTQADDVRLVPGYTDEDSLETLESQSFLTPGAWEIGLGRARVLSPIGRDDAADRWYAGEMGPQSAMAKNAALSCDSCGFLVTMGGVFGQMFGVCANVMAPGDGHVVALDYGCGAHSEVQIEEIVTGEPIDAADDDLVEDAIEEIIETASPEDAEHLVLDVSDVEDIESVDVQADEPDQS